MSYLSNDTYSVSTDLPHEQSYIMSQGYTESPCLNHPRLGGPCPAKDRDKDFSIACQNCGPRGMGDCWDPENFVYNKPVVSQDRRLHQCGFPGCNKLTKAEYCRTCQAIQDQREKAWELLHDGPMPDEIRFKSY
jgi:hypothetical protein